MIKNSKKGAVMIMIVLFFIVLSTTLLVGVSYPISNQIKGTGEFLKSKETFNIADSQIENALYRFNKGKSDAPTDINLLGATATAILTDIGNERNIVVQGTKSFFERYIKAIFKTDIGTSFNYGLQVGSGGLYMDGSAKINGNVYANGDIVGISGTQWSQQNEIKGSVVSATLSNSTELLSIYDVSASSSHFSFGLNNNNQDIAQSFIAATTTPINEIHFYIKKTGTPANAVVKIVNDNNGNPGPTVLTSGTLNSLTVTNSFAYVPVVMSSQFSMMVGNTYWIIIDNPSNDNNKYYSLIAYSDYYTDGNTKQGRFVNNLSNIGSGNIDFNMKIFVGGDKGSISGVKIGSSASDEAWAHNINNTTVSGSLFCQNGAGNNKSCDMSRPEPVSAPYPISQANIDEWKSQAEAGGATSSIIIDGSKVRTFGPIKINGDLIIENSGKLYITGPIYVAGDVIVSGSGKIYVDQSLGSASVNIISDGLIKIEGSGGIYGSGVSGSYVVLNSLLSCDGYSNCSSNPAIHISGSAGSVVLNAPNGAVKLEGSAKIKAGVSKMLIMDGSTIVDYESGLTSVNFTSGPSGSWVKQSWKEVLGW